MATVPAFEPMSVDRSGTLAEFARACKSAARSVSLYPATHPAIQASLGRVVAASARLTAAGSVTIVVHPGVLTIDGQAPARGDQAVTELADLLHERLVGWLKIEQGADALDWHALLLLMARAPDELFGGGGIGQAWAAAQRAHFEIGEIDYAEVLRERTGGHALDWNQIIEQCLQGATPTFDERTLAEVLDIAGDPARWDDLIDQLRSGSGDASIGARANALLTLLRGLAKALADRPADLNGMLQTVADASSRLTPEMLTALLREAREGAPEDREVVSGVTSRMGDGAVATFVAKTVIAENGATQRLAQAFEALVPESDRKGRLLELVHAELEASPMGHEPGFENLWQDTAGLLMTYSDEGYVSDDYGRELSGARAQALEVERVSNDPPDRIEAWLSTISETALQDLDLALLLDLLRIEAEPSAWQPLADVVAGDVERRTVMGDFDGALRLLEAVASERGPHGREGLRAAAVAAVDVLAAGPLGRHIVTNLRRTDEEGVEALTRLCRAIGPGIVKSLAEGLAMEEHTRAIRRLRELLLSFGPAGRSSFEQLKHSHNPAVRRTAIDLLRVFGGHEALPELASMLDDADPQVQRESIRAILQIGTNQAYAVLERALLIGSAARDTILQQLIGLRDDKTVPLLCYVLDHVTPKGRRVGLHLQIVEALSHHSAHPDSTRTLQRLLFKGDWWAPLRTARLRRAAAAALRRLGTTETMAVLEDAVAHGRRGVRSAARAELSAPSRKPS